MLEKAKGFGKIAGGIAIGAAVLSIPVVLLFGAAWASEKISPWLKPSSVELRNAAATPTSCSAPTWSCIKAMSGLTTTVTPCPAR